MSTTDEVNGGSGPTRDVDVDAGDATAVALAVVDAVQVGGPTVAEEPRRVQGLLNDILGSGARSRRAEVDAVVLAAEEGIADDLLSGTDPSDALERLRLRGLDAEVARFAVDVWRFALGLQPDDVEVPSLRTSQRSDATDAAVGVAASGSVDDAVNVSTLERPDTALVEPVDGGGEVADDIGSQSADRVPAGLGSVEGTSVQVPWWRRRWVAFAGAGGAVALVVVVALVATLVVPGGGTDGDEAVPDDRPVEVDSAPLEVTFDRQQSDLGALARTWTVDDGVLTASLVFTNNGSGVGGGKHLEVVPKSLAATADLITSEPAHEVVAQDPVIAWSHIYGPGETFEVTYRIAVPEDTTQEHLEKWKSDQLTAQQEFMNQVAKLKTPEVEPPTTTTTAPRGDPDPSTPTSTTSPPLPALEAWIEGDSTPTAGIGCYYYFTLKTNFVPTSIIWSGVPNASTFNGVHLIDLFVHQHEGPRTATLSARVTAPDGRTITASLTLRIDYWGAC